MTSIIKVDQIQKADGSTPTAGDLGLNTAGSVLQVVTKTHDPGSQSITSNSLVDIGLSVNITPRSSSSRFIIMVCLNECYVSASANAIGVAITRDGSRLHDTDNATLGYTSSGGSNYFNVNLHCVDAPNTTSQITYACYAKSRYSGTTVSVNGDNSPTFITVMEIAG